MKPDGVPQWAWLRMKEATTNSSGNGGVANPLPHHHQVLVARAILKARSQAFEEAIQVVEAVERDYLLRANAAAEVGGYVTSYNAAEISQAIRQHSQKGRNAE